MYGNVKRQRTICRPSDPPASTSKAELHPKKVLLSECWDAQGIIHWEVLPLNQTINAAFYCLPLHRLHSNLVAKRLGLINRHGVILRHENTKLHTIVITLQKFMGFG
ncbi:histone-lysine N-methyltransferase SETMAR [Trichonephila clavipes]|nr:histone-lysine N-methyltransferase SETMAR [Trichonephila clavipes]